MSLLQLEGVSRRFGQVVVAEEISFQLDKGDAVGMIGPNGAGKTTLFAMISGDVRPNSGRILLDGDNVVKMAPSKRARAGIG
ncbi:MAG TPA: ATP-binding cassette domain-containing protein, partial [Acidimicrobiales bacterium]